MAQNEQNHAFVRMDEHAYHTALWIEDCLSGLWSLGVTPNRICIKQSDPVVIILVDGTIKYRYRGDLAKGNACSPDADLRLKSF